MQCGVRGAGGEKPRTSHFALRTVLAAPRTGVQDDLADSSHPACGEPRRRPDGPVNAERLRRGNRLWGGIAGPAGLPGLFLAPSVAAGGRQGPSSLARLLDRFWGFLGYLWVPVRSALGGPGG